VYLTNTFPKTQNGALSKQPNVCLLSCRPQKITGVKTMHSRQNHQNHQRSRYYFCTNVCNSSSWLPVEPHPLQNIGSWYRATIGSGPVYILDVVKPHTPARSLRSATANRHVTPALRAKNTSFPTISGLKHRLALQWLLNGSYSLLMVLSSFDFLEEMLISVFLLLSFYSWLMHLL